MDRRTRNLFVGALVVLVAIMAVAAIALGGGRQPGSSAEPSAAPSMEGIVVAIQSEGLDQVRGFRIRTAGGAIVDFTLNDLENGALFPPGHLAEHQATAQPVRVTYRVRDGVNVAIRLEDVP